MTQETIDLTSDSTTAAPAAAPTGGGIDAAVLVDLDANGDGVLQLAVATPGPRDDGGYYQALVEQTEAYALGRQWPSPIIEDNIPAADAEPRLTALAEREPDVIFVGASEIAEPLVGIAETYQEIFWYCRCGADFPETDWVAQSSDDSSEISLTAGYATALLLNEDPAAPKGTAFIGNNHYGFENEALAAFELGLEEGAEHLGQPRDTYTVQYFASGSFDVYQPDPEDPDHEGIVGAKPIYDQVVRDGGFGAVYPYLGGAHVPIVADANKDGLIVMSAGASRVCTDPPVHEDTGEPVFYDLEVRFDGGDYLQVVMQELFSGQLLEGDNRKFVVGETGEIIVDDAGTVKPDFVMNGAVVCEAELSPEARARISEAMDTIYGRIADGEFAARFDAIRAEAYGGG
ncbi:MAG: hypothetical protein S0880_35505 [Actinomycetota bacterium]|nr:hypothetical protein [Actinomycetota bacterium]